jgi:hypothetical protein
MHTLLYALKSNSFSGSSWKRVGNSSPIGSENR